MKTNGTVIVLGTFDGVHVGHMALIERAKAAANKASLPMLIYTFENHPLEIFDRKPKLLLTHSERLAALKARAGGGEVIADKFTKEYSATSPEDFAIMLKDRFSAKHVVVGYNHTFGSGGKGTPELLRELGARLGFTVDIVEPVLYKGDAVSSTRIRAALESGDIISTNEMLGTLYSLSGNVRHDRGIGASLGFPTANIDYAKCKQLPLAGVYATRAEVDGASYTGVSNIGTNPTVNGERTSVETHIIDFSGNIYGEQLKIEFLSRLRGEVKFESTAALAEQIARDVESAREFNRAK